MDDRRRRMILGGLALTGSSALPALAQETSFAERFAARLSAHDIDGFAALFAETYVNHQQSAAAPGRPDLSAKQATVGFFKARLMAMPDLAVAIEQQVRQDDKVAASFVYTDTHQGPYFGIAPTGKRLLFSSCDIFRIKDGQIAEHWGMGDIAGIMAQLKG